MRQTPLLDRVAHHLVAVRSGASSASLRRTFHVTSSGTKVVEHVRLRA